MRQPLIIMPLATGILAGPSGLATIESHAQIELLASIAIALLLPTVGLKLDRHLVRTTGPAALAKGVGQIVLTSAFGLRIALVMGLGFVEAACVAVSLTFPARSSSRRVDFDPAVLGCSSAHGMSVLHGDVADPKIHETRPLGKTRWVVSTIRQSDLSLALLELLRGRACEGRAP